MNKTIFNPGHHSKHIDIALLLLRLVLGIFMLTHGYGKLEKLFGDEPIKFADPIGIGVTASLALAVFAEFFCSLLLIAGLGTRLAVIPLIVTMFVAVFIAQAGNDFGKRELPLLYLVLYVIILITGAGSYSIDKCIYKK